MSRPALMLMPQLNDNTLSVTPLCGTHQQPNIVEKAYAGEVMVLILLTHSLPDHMGSLLLQDFI